MHHCVCSARPQQDERVNLAGRVRLVGGRAFGDDHRGQAADQGAEGVGAGHRGEPGRDRLDQVALQQEGDGVGARDRPQADGPAHVAERGVQLPIQVKL